MIDTEALRKKVIDLAIQGKLTEQLPADGDAEELYARIQQKKKRIVDSGVLKKRKKAEALAVDGSRVPFDIPDNWKWTRLGNVSEIFGRIGFRGYTKNDIVPPHTGAITISPSNVLNSGKTEFIDCTYLSWDKYNESPEIMIENDDILVVKTGSSYGKTGIVKNLPEKATINPQIAVLKYVLCDSEYLNYVLNSSFSRTQFEEFVVGAAIPTFSQEKLAGLLIPLAPLSEQKRIVNRIERIHREIDIIDSLNKKHINDLAVLKSKIIDAGIQGKLTAQLPEDGDAETLYAQIQEERGAIIEARGGRKDKSIKTEDEKKPFDIPHNWKWIRFGEVGLFKKGPFGSALTKSMFIPKSKDAIKVYEQQHAIRKEASLGTYYISHEYFESNMSGFEVKSGDIIVSCAGTIGETYVLPDEMEQGIINQALMRVTLVPSIDKEFFLFYFDSNLKTNAQNESNGMAIKNIPPFDVMKNWYFPLPPVAEQRRIVNRISEIIEYLL